MIPDLAVNRLAGTFILCLLATPALADVTGLARVIDGDTVEIHGQRIRLHGIDAPEGRQLCRRDGKRWQCGKDAANIRSVTDVFPGQTQGIGRQPEDLAVRPPWHRCQDTDRGVLIKVLGCLERETDIMCHDWGGMEL